ncbi:hypothetical protein AYL99_11698 [Fonsecaea erecta]|uniref:Uncharacterized protein n=1 Tax=Fonsecaea erecta TaxID=1367422 RepID=A0A178Z4P9_9EURO|nr:hypothetical protein AYL99_11698 [Fonsecaea erecta]OAP54163.1 hypothetical protein AYL99_11698 [Fonsecaea erecta]
MDTNGGALKDIPRTRFSDTIKTGVDLLTRAVEDVSGILGPPTRASSRAWSRSGRMGLLIDTFEMMNLIRRAWMIRNTNVLIVLIIDSRVDGFLDPLVDVSSILVVSITTQPTTQGVGPIGNEEN